MKLVIVINLRALKCCVRNASRDDAIDGENMDNENVTDDDGTYNGVFKCSVVKDSSLKSDQTSSSCCQVFLTKLRHVNRKRES